MLETINSGYLEKDIEEKKGKAEKTEMVEETQTETVEGE